MKSLVCYLAHLIMTSLQVTGVKRGYSFFCVELKKIVHSARLYVTGSEKRDHFREFFKIERPLAISMPASVQSIILDAISWNSRKHRLKYYHFRYGDGFP